MRFLVIVFFCTTLGLSNQAWGQSEIAIVDLQLVLDLMPESGTVEQELNIYRRKRMQALQPLSDSIKKLTSQLQQQARAGVDRSALQPFAVQIDSMQQRLKREEQAVEAAVTYRQQLFAREIKSKIDRHLAELAEENNVKYIFNARASGASLLLNSRSSEDNLTRTLLEHMHVPLGSASAESVNAAEEEE